MYLASVLCKHGLLFFGSFGLPQSPGHTLDLKYVLVLHLRWTLCLLGKRNLGIFSFTKRSLVDSREQQLPSLNIVFNISNAAD